MIQSEFWFEGVRRNRLFGRTWLPETEPTALFCIVHGIGEHIGRYRNVVTQLLLNKIGVAAFDLRGHGRSAGPRGHIDSWSDYLSDLRAFLDVVRTEFPSLSIYLYGHSLGSLIVADFALAEAKGLDGVVLSSLAVQPVGAAKPTLVAIARLLSGIYPTFPIFLGLPTRALSRDLNEVELYNADPLVHGVGTARWGTEALGAVARLRSSNVQFSVPVLVIHGGADRINSVEGAREFFIRAAASGSEFHVYADAFHEPHNDLDSQKVLADLLDWLKVQLGQSPISRNAPPASARWTRRFDTERYPTGWLKESLTVEKFADVASAHSDNRVDARVLREFDAVNAARIPLTETVGHYESYFQRANHPTRPLALWIRYTAFRPKSRPGDALGQLWAIYFDGETRTITAVKENHPLSLCRFSSERLSVQIGSSVLEEGWLKGQASSNGSSIQWSLAYTGDQAPLLLLPTERYESTFPAAKALVGLPLATYTGKFRVNGKLTPIDGWVGSQNHNWGSRHTDEYAWGQVAGFDNNGEAFLECVTARLRVGPLWTPRLTNVVLRLCDQTYSLNSIRQGLSAEATLENFTWSFWSETPQVKVSGVLVAQPEDFVALSYENPPGGRKTCLNTKIASCRIVVERPGSEPISLSAKSRAAFEIISDEYSSVVRRGEA